ncbi:MAG: HAMP domain-containing histidine kinase [Clostridiales bacterium]|nr:HAMP domain-containing histidine kinase [Clostridiales bacterium]
MLKDKNLQEQTQLVSQISHDLRNILTLIDSSLQLMESNHPEVADYKYWPETKKDIKYMKTYLIALSNYNKSGVLSLTTFDLRRMLTELHQELSFTLLEKNISITLDLNQDIQYIIGDPMKLNHVIKNIISNSLEACEATDTYGRIRVILEKTESGILLKISDNGQGILPEFINDAFSPFSTSKKEHVGLGLSTCQRIIQAHNGTIEIESNLSEGTTVIINLPFIKE